MKKIKPNGFNKTEDYKFTKYSSAVEINNSDALAQTVVSNLVNRQAKHYFVAGVKGQHFTTN